MTLLDIIPNQKLSEKPSDTPKCPICGSILLHNFGTETTLVGGGNGPDNDPNHTWTSFHCNSCTARFTRQTHRGNVWYVFGDVIKSGIMSCTCSRTPYWCNCGEGKVRLQHTELDGETSVQSLYSSVVAGKWKKWYRSFYICDMCGVKVEVDD